MNGLCSACKQPVEVVDFRLDEGIVVVRCPACGKQQRLSLSEASDGLEGPGATEAEGAVSAPLRTPPPGISAPPGTSIAPAFEPPAAFCPKCIAPRTAAAQSCPSCGLVFGRPLSADVRPSPGLMSAFSALSAEWGGAPAHLRFLQLAAERGELAAAGRLYRIRLANAPTDAVARASLEATVKMASAAVRVAAIKSAPVADPDAARKRKLLLMAITLLGPALLFALLRLLVRH